MKVFLPIRSSALRWTVAATLILLVAGGVFGRSVVFHSATAPPVTFQVGDERGDPDAGQVNAASYAAEIRALPASVIPPHAYRRGIRQSRAMPRISPIGQGWQIVGPIDSPNSNVPDPHTGRRNSISGRVTALALAPSCTNICSTIYAGSAGGGLWETTDDGQTWTPLLDKQPTLAIGSIAIDPRTPNTIYVGTGDPTRGGGAEAGQGILRTTDGGATWTTLGENVFDNLSITSLLIDPRTAGSATATRLFATTTYGELGGSPTGGGNPDDAPNLPDRGLLESDDSGQTWRQVGPSAANGVSVESLVMSPTNPDLMYVTVATHGIYETTDGARTWHKLSRGLPNSSTFTYSSVVIAPDNPLVLYAAFDFDAVPPGFETLYRTIDGGATWKQLKKAPDACGSQCWTGMTLAVSPTNFNTVYIGGTANYDYIDFGKGACARLKNLPKGCEASIARSTDGGVTWQDIGENGGNGPVHPDTHALAIVPGAPNDMYLGDDGGVFHSTDGGSSWQSLNNGLATVETQALSIDKAGNIYTGTQDNGTFVYRAASHTWKHTLDGDGGVTAVDPKNTKISYAERYGASLRRNDSTGAPYKYLYIAAFEDDYFVQGRGNFYEPFAVSHSAPNNIFAGTYRLWRSKMRGGVDGNHNGVTFDSMKDKVDWTPISFDLSCFSKPSKPSRQCASPDTGDNGIASIAVAPSNPNTVVVGDSSGSIWLTTNALAKVRTDRSCDPRPHFGTMPRCHFVSGVTWKRIDTGLPHRFPTSISFLPDSNKKLMISFSGFDETTRSHPGHVFTSANLGKSWRSLTGSGTNTRLPDLPISDVIVNPANGHLYVSSDYGVYASLDGGKQWALFSIGLPAVPVYQLQLDPTTDNLVAATYGRGIWQIAAP